MCMFMEERKKERKKECKKERKEEIVFFSRVAQLCSSKGCDSTSKCMPLPKTCSIKGGKQTCSCIHTHSTTERLFSRGHKKWPRVKALTILPDLLGSISKPGVST